MNANELMIGDWVVYDGDVDFTNPVRVDGIDAATGSLITSDREDVGIEGVQPIPLTDEILANNFVVTDDTAYGKHYGYYNDFMEVDICEYTDGIWQVVVDEIEMSGLPTWKMYVEDVHQLQHALRLSGIKMEIKL